MGNLWLIGMMGSGKTTVGKRVARIRGLPFTDVDRLVEGRAAKSVMEIFRQDGEDAFRRLESAEIGRLATRTAGHGEGRVIATGGGVVLDTRSVEAMRRTGVVVVAGCSPSGPGEPGGSRTALAGRLRRRSPPGGDTRPATPSLRGSGPLQARCRPTTLGRDR